MSFLFARRPVTNEVQQTAERLHDYLVAGVRRTAFYLHLGVPDTFEGRFDLLMLHVAVALRRLRDPAAAGDAVAQALVDTMFARFDIGLREMGVSDLGVPKRMKRLAEAFNGRTVAYLAALDAEDREGLAEAVKRNVLNGVGDGHPLADYARHMDALFSSCNLVAGQLPLLPEPH